MATATAEQREDKKKPAVPRDPVREAVETIVFVVVLVLLLKLFVTEAFVIPTGSMAETLYGYQKVVTCPKCGHEFPVNSHDEVEGRDGVRHRLAGYTCPNCRYPGKFEVKHDGTIDSPTNRTGDRVLVLKPIYHVQSPHRGDVVVFKYPEKPQEKQTAQNYIKRAQGFGGETIAIHHGDLYVTKSLTYSEDERDADGNPIYPVPADPNDLWKPQYMYSGSPRAAELFEASRKAGFPAGPVNQLPAKQQEHFKPLVDAGWFPPTGTGFEIIRKPTDQVMADRRIVWDNDHQPRELAGKVPPRWYVSDGNWNGDVQQNEMPRTFAHTAGELNWIRYRHFTNPWTGGDVNPHQVDNFLGYNEGVLEGGFPRDSSATGYWVGDLIVECEAQVGDGAEVVLELSKGQNRFRATFGGGKVVLSCTVPSEKDKTFGERPCKVSGAGNYRLRFANVDSRLRAWVDDKLIDFGTDADYLPGMTVPPGPGESEGFTQENDVAAPASIGAKGQVKLSAIKLHRDVYYTHGQYGWHLFYVQPGHYLCLGDNSAQSSDSRSWGLVPERLMLGKAVFVFWPAIPSPNRVGFIK